MSAGQNAVMPVMQMLECLCVKSVIAAPRLDNLVKSVIAVLDTAIYCGKEIPASSTGMTMWQMPECQCGRCRTDSAVKLDCQSSKAEMPVMQRLKCLCVKSVIAAH